MDPQPDFLPIPGEAVTLAPGLRRILAPNPSPMTYRGTNTYLLGEREIAVIDPGPDSAPHLEAILAAVAPDARISHILVTHAHLDHSPLARPLSERTGAPVYGFGPATAGRSDVMIRLAADGLTGGGEGVDSAFEPDETLNDGAELTGKGWTLTALHTPGHMANHLAFAWGDALFTGDLVMGWASSLVSPPDGDLTDFMRSLRSLQKRPWATFHPGHGAPVSDPQQRLEELITHRLSREAAILAALQDGPATAADLAARIYTDTPPALLPAAERNVFSHLIDLVTKNAARAVEDLSISARFSAV
ncbi:MBL fold metallo-hydrolase [Pacificoceanicola onchidii]|uniref:MBL fold metallo-hydrolase n=1 Tax=Pacificoceanicola onchidii TaxID=2562685 RepID=UPI003B82E97A